jgi:hypothetical protein
MVRLASFITSMTIASLAPGGRSAFKQAGGAAGTSSVIITVSRQLKENGFGFSENYVAATGFYMGRSTDA